MDTTADYLCWTHAPHGLVTGDITEAMRWFQEVTGRAAKLLVLNPRNERYAKEVGNGVYIDYQLGCLLWEVWISANNKTPRVAAEHSIQPPSNFVTVEHATKCPNVKGDKNNCGDSPTIEPSMAKRGRRPMSLPESQIIEMYHRGLGAKRIASALGDEGVRVSYRTVARLVERNCSFR